MKLVIKRYEIILGILVLVLTGSVNIVSKTTIPQYELSKLRYPYRVALTFDDGPYPKYTERLLAILDDENIRATFFVIGQDVDKYPELLKLIVAKGHQVGNHTYFHSRLVGLSEEKILLEIERTQNLINQSGYKGEFLFRPPGGKIGSRARKIIEEKGYTIVLWTVLPKDHEYDATKDKIIQRVKDNIKDRGIILLHQGRPETIAALPEIIRQLKSEGYQFVPVSLLNQ